MALICERRTSIQNQPEIGRRMSRSRRRCPGRRAMPARRRGAGSPRGGSTWSAVQPGCRGRNRTPRSRGPRRTSRRTRSRSSRRRAGHRRPGRNPARHGPSGPASHGRGGPHPRRHSTHRNVRGRRARSGTQSRSGHAPQVQTPIDGTDWPRPTGPAAAGMADQLSSGVFHGPALGSSAGQNPNRLQPRALPHLARLRGGNRRVGPLVRHEESTLSCPCAAPDPGGRPTSTSPNGRGTP
jgi:hypothetical protein